MKSFSRWAEIFTTIFALIMFLTASFIQTVEAQGKTRKTQPAQLKNKEKAYLIIAGQSAGGLLLDDSREKAISYFGQLDSEYDYDLETKFKCPARKELHFWDMRNQTSPLFRDYGNGAWVYLVEDRIEQIKIQSEKFKTSEGLTTGSTPEQVKRFYPGIRTFVELNSQCDCTGGRNLIFWVDKERGIAFEFQYWREPQARRVSYIYIFTPNTEFFPEGCIYLETQGWKEIAPFSLEEPAGMQEEWEKEHKDNREKIR